MIIVLYITETYENLFGIVRTWGTELFIFNEQILNRYNLIVMSYPAVVKISVLCLHSRFLLLKVKNIINIGNIILSEGIYWEILSNHDIV